MIYIYIILNPRSDPSQLCPVESARDSCAGAGRCYTAAVSLSSTLSQSLKPYKIYTLSFMTFLAAT